MSFNTEKRAIRAATKLQKMLGKGWEIRVFENLGWHASCVYKNKLEVSVSSKSNGDTEYWTHCHGGTLAMFNPVCGHDTDPLVSVNKFVKGYKDKYETFIKEQGELVKTMSEVI